MAGVQQVWVHPPPPAVKGKTLLERIGGVPALTKFVDDFYDAMLKDKQIAPVLKKSQQTQSEEVYMKLLKERTVEYLECVWGGDAWEGQDMFVAHAALHISTQTYDAAMKIAKSKINAMSMAADAKKHAMDELWAMKEPMTDPDGKFHAWVHEKNRAIEKKMLEDGAVDLTGMGFTTSPAMVKAMKEKAEKEAQRKERMLAQKAKREAEEKEKKKREKQDKKAKEKAEQETDGSSPVLGALSAIGDPSTNPAPPVNAESDPTKTSATKSKDKKHIHAKKINPKANAGKSTKSAEEKDKETSSMCVLVPDLPPEDDEIANILESRATPLFLLPLITCI